MVKLPLLAQWAIRLLLTSVLAPALASADAGGDAAPPALLVMGDSLSAAYGIATEEGWVSLLAVRLETVGLKYRVVNASISGETTSGGLARLPKLLAEHRPRVLMIALGANDGLRGLTYETVGDNLRRMIGLGREAGALVLVAGVRLPPNYGTAYTDGFQAVFESLAKSEGVPLVPQILGGVDADWGLMQADGLHPSAAAQPRILDNLWPQLESVLRQATSGP